MSRLIVRRHNGFPNQGARTQPIVDAPNDVFLTATHQSGPAPTLTVSLYAADEEYGHAPYTYNPAYRASACANRALVADAAHLQFHELGSHSPSRSRNSESNHDGSSTTYDAEITRCAALESAELLAASTCCAQRPGRAS